MKRFFDLVETVAKKNGEITIHIQNTPSGTTNFGISVRAGGRHFRDHMALDKDSTEGFYFWANKFVDYLLSGELLS